MYGRVNLIIRSMRKIPQFHLISTCGNFVERHSFRIVSGESPETLRKLCLSTKFQHQEIRWNYGIFCGDLWQGFWLKSAMLFVKLVFVSHRNSLWKKSIQWVLYYKFLFSYKYNLIRIQAWIFKILVKFLEQPKNKTAWFCLNDLRTTDSAFLLKNSKVFFRKQAPRGVR